ncbi:hypothetical protein Aduo_016265 [Ancylostoma duodenale]|uniref:Isy1-like splicing family protein n=2 Tax=Ancylostoma TaxID=29169 RepID=A0A016UVY3_9BILA|nr:hypothetical protein Y032_0026g1464 [Ancylostoma ceylanicum]
MARNAEKAMTALARWRRLKEEEEKGPIAKRPHDTSLCHNLADAERFRREIAKEIAKKIALIQNPGLGEFKIRDLNDEINKMIRIKYAWEMRIKELGGMDYRKISSRELDKEGKEVASNKGYKYFGAAKDLPGVRQLFEESKELEQMRKTRAELMKNVDADYYGYLDDDDGLLIPLEKEEEKKAIAQAEKYFAEHGAERFQKEFGDDLDEDIYKIQDDSDGEDIDTKESIVVGEDGKQMTIKHVLVPSQKDIEEMIIERKKQELIEKYLSSE